MLRRGVSDRGSARLASPWKRPERRSCPPDHPLPVRAQAAGLQRGGDARIKQGSKVKEDTLVVHEIYASIQGESTFAGMPCTFVRLTGCNLRCVWCDTPQAFYGGTRMLRRDVLARALALRTPLVELTGGEP